MPPRQQSVNAYTRVMTPMEVCRIQEGGLQSVTSYTRKFVPRGADVVDVSTGKWVNAGLKRFDNYTRLKNNVRAEAQKNSEKAKAHRAQLSDKIMEKRLEEEMRADDEKEKRKAYVDKMIKKGEQISKKKKDMQDVNNMISTLMNK